MYPQPPFQAKITINPASYKQNNNSSGLNIIHHQYIPQQPERTLNHHHAYPTYNYQTRPSSTSNARAPLQHHILAPSYPPNIIPSQKYIRYESTKKIQVVFQQSKRQQVGSSDTKQKEGGSFKEIITNSCPNSNNKKAVIKSLIFPSSEQPNINMKMMAQRKYDFYPKTAAQTKTHIPNFDQMNQLNIPVHNIQDYRPRQIKTDRVIIGRKEHTLAPNISIAHNLKYKNQSLEVDSKDKIDYKQLESTSNSFQHIFVVQKQNQKKESQAGNNLTIKKNMTQANFWPNSHSPLQKNQPNAPLFHNFQATSKEQQQSDPKNQSGESIKKNNLQFLKNIKKKKEQIPQKQFDLSDFDLMDKLGKGAFGDAFVAQEKVTGFMCVIKKLSKKRLIEHKLQQQLFRQIKIQTYLHHRHLTSLYAFFCDQEYIYIILELLPDGSMMQSNKKRKIPQNQVSTYIRQISLGLKYMHTENVIHRDIKPQNIFLYEDYAKIGDFGCSIYTSTNRSTQIGSLAYLSPQQLKQQAYNQKIDVWSLGVMAYEMLTGASPFQKDIIKIARKEMALQLSDVKFADNVVLTEQAKDFLIGMLNIDAEKRFGIQQVLRHQFILKYLKEDESKLQKLMK